VKFLRSKRGLAAVAALLLVLFLWRPGVYKLRDRISGSIGTALNRKVTLDNVSLHFLPRPGFDLEGLVIYDDPAFSAEPMMRAQNVSAAIRLTSLLRGRIEIATLSATDPSVNLVRNSEGRWNLASLLERNAQIPAAPTAKAASERRPAFPYLEASGARINFKIGQTKKSYALMDADVALWQDSENSWGARIKAEPVRTDFNLTDTGLLQINATWQRAASLRLTPLQITAQWQKGQLGQVTKLLSGKDRGWRGGISLTANLSGTPEVLKIESQTSIDDFHRFDIVESANLRLSAGCSGQYDAVTGALADLLCEAPVNGGAIRLRGSLALAAPTPAYDLTLAVEKIPLASVVRLLRQAKKQIPSDLTASGALNAEFHAVTNGASVPKDARPVRLEEFSGTGVATDVHLASNGGRDAVDLGTIRLTLLDAETLADKTSHPRKNEPKDDEPGEPHLRIGPVALALNAGAPVNAGGWVSSAGYLFFLRGDVELKNLFRLENVLGLPTARPAAEGEAQLDVSVSGSWQGFAPPVTLGTAQLRNVRGEMHGLNTPIEIGSASISLTPDAVLLQKIVAHTGDTHWSGAVTVPRPCVVPKCLLQFDLAADQLSTGDLLEWFEPHTANRPWYRILSRDQPPGNSPLLAIHAHGNLHVGRFGFKKMVATQVVSQVDADRGNISLTNLRGQLLQGTHQGNWVIDVSGYDPPKSPVAYHGRGVLQNISLEQVGALMGDAWVSGTADGKFELDGSGDSFHELLASSTGMLKFAMRSGSFSHIEIPGFAGPLQVHRFAGDLRLTKDVWELSAGKLDARDGVYVVSGTASPAKGLDFVLTRGDERAWTLAGTLAKPLVTPAIRAEAKTNTVKP
jgi:uncharacterized protein involved in outer membrane biogenesis